MLSKKLFVALIAGIVVAVPSPQSLSSDVTILSDNDLQGPGGPGSAFGALYISRKQSLESGVASCKLLGEQLWFPGVHNRETEILGNHLRSVKQNQAWILSNGTASRAIGSSGDFVMVKETSKLPVLCTQSAPYSNATFADISQKWQINVQSNNEIVTGFRDRLTFRFRGIRLAPQPKRFTYATMYNGSGEVVPALKYGPQCIQVSGGSEDCLFLNIWTPSLPTPCTNTLISRCQKLRPVLFWIFGGGFTENSAADPNFDGGNMASRGDVVMIAVNYRVGAFGFLALKDGVTNGNFGIADQILGLDWVRKHIQDFGGDPEHITIVGQSSGGASVRALMASPRAAGKFIAAVPMSAPGSKGFSDFYTIDEANEVSGNGIVDAANCTDAQSQVDCLRGLDAATLVPIGMTANFLVIDGLYLNTPRLQLTNATQAPYRLMTGFMRDDAAPFLSFPPNITGKDQEEWLTSQGIPNPSRSLFPLPDLTNQTLAVYKVGARVYTDIAFRCMNQAAAYAGLKNRVFIEIYFFEFDRSYQTPDWPLSDLCEAPRLSGRPFGDPEAEPENFHCHSGQLLWVFGNIRRFGLPYRDEIGDMEFEQNIVDRWASFVRGGTPDVGSEWEPAVANKTQMLSLKWPKSSMTEFRDLEQCEWLGLPLDYLS